MGTADYFAVCVPGLFISASARDPDLENAVDRVQDKLDHLRKTGKVRSVAGGCERISTIDIYDARGHKEVWLDMSGVNGDGGGDPPKLIEARKVRVW